MPLIRKGDGLHLAHQIEPGSILRVARLKPDQDFLSLKFPFDPNLESLVQ